MIIEFDQQDDVFVLRFRGRLAGDHDREYLAAKWEEIKRLNRTKVLADLGGVPSIASMGIGFVVAIYTSVSNSGGRFVLVGALPMVRKVFDLTRLSTVIPIAPDFASALNRLHA